MMIVKKREGEHMSYVDTFIGTAADCPVSHSAIPELKKDKRCVIVRRNNIFYIMQKTAKP